MNFENKKRLIVKDKRKGLSLDDMSKYIWIKSVFHTTHNCELWKAT